MKMRCFNRSGFTLIELLVVITIILVLMAIALPVYGMFKRNTRIALAKNTMQTLKMAVEKYKEDLGEYPPDDLGGSEMIYTYLCNRLNPQVKLPNGQSVPSESHFGPYLQTQADQIADSTSGGAKKFMSPLGNEYSYVVIVDTDTVHRNFLLVDPGADKALGGSLNNTTGFTSSGPESDDNIFSSTQKNQSQP